MGESSQSTEAEVIGRSMSINWDDLAQVKSEVLKSVKTMW